jgi:arginyl-tRNA---protein transferase
MIVEHYQALIDRGWRRSGHTYYKPDLTRSCCPHYTIRLDAGMFKASKSQRQALNRWNRYVLGAEYISKVGKLCPRSREEKQRRKSAFDLECSVHASEYAKLERPVDPKTKKRIEPAHKFEISLESDSPSEEKRKVFLPYQTTIHKDPESRWKDKAFDRFLCSGLDRKIIKSKGVTRKLGSYHQCYRLDGLLIAVAVLDLLPHGVSSVYLL